MITNVDETIAQKLKKRGKNPIKHYNKKGFIPVWVAIPEMRLGDTITLLECLDRNMKQKIASYFAYYLKIEKSDIRLDYDTLISIFKNMREFRNIVAHNNRLIKYKCFEHIKYIPNLHDKFGILPRDERQSWYSFIVSIQMFLPKTEAEILNRIIYNDIYEYMINHYPHIDWMPIFNSIGIKNRFE